MSAICGSTSGRNGMGSVIRSPSGSNPTLLEWQTCLKHVEEPASGRFLVS